MATWLDFYRTVVRWNGPGSPGYEYWRRVFSRVDWADLYDRPRQLDLFE